jgi:CRP-like cAMP-binding protein
MGTVALQPNDINKILANVQFFAGLEGGELEQVVQAARMTRVEVDTYLYFEGDPADELHVLLQGNIRLSQLTPEGQQVILRYASSGEAFGIIAVLSGTNYPVTAQAVEECLVLAWGETEMNGLMAAIPRLALNAMKIMAAHLREFQDRIRELSTERVEQRIARAVLRLARQSGRKTEEGILLDLPVSRQDLAELTGTTLYTVSRTLSGWEQQGLIKSGREEIIILFPHGLVAIAEDLPD